MNSFNDQIAVVTGAGSGIGKAITLSLAEQGATVCAVDRRVEALEGVVSSGGAPISRQLLRYQVDLTQDEDIKRLVTKFETDFRQIDILIHSAGVFARGPLAKASVSGFENQFRVNVLAPYALTQALLPMLPPERGQIVFVNSTAGLTSSENVGQYAATKHALKAIADSLRDEVNRHGIRVLSIYPGRTATAMQALVHEMENKTYHPNNLMQPEDVAAVITHALSLPRTAEVTEIRMRPLKRPTP
jgi:NADP-dependent 3-hydroxy acid dehydrogenase YdfG